MTASTSASWVLRVLGLLPAPLRRALDDWSAGVAARKAHRRRAAASSRTGTDNLA